MTRRKKVEEQTGPNDPTEGTTQGAQDGATADSDVPTGGTDGTDNPDDSPDLRLIAVCASIAKTDVQDWPMYPHLTQVAAYNFNVEDPWGKQAAAGMVYGALVAFEYVRRFGADAIPTPTIYQ